MRIYIAGPMRGIENFNFPAFHKAAAELRALGHEVFNPAEKDIEKYGYKLLNSAGDENEASSQVGFSLRDALAMDLEWICQHADAIALLPGWRKSKGATAEHATAVALGHTIIEYSDQM